MMTKKILFLALCFWIIFSLVKAQETTGKLKEIKLPSPRLGGGRP